MSCLIWICTVCKFNNFLFSHFLSIAGILLSAYNYVLGCIEEDRAISELCYKGIILYRNSS